MSGAWKSDHEKMEAHTMKYAVKDILMPDRPDVSKVYVAYANVMLLNKSADPDAKIIWLIQCPSDRFPAPVTLV